MPRIKETTVYKFDELDAKAKEKARDWFREGITSDSNLHDFTLSDFATVAAFCGWTLDVRDKNAAIYWSGFSCQGDGASFEGSWDSGAVKLDKLKEYAPKDEKLHAIGARLDAITSDEPEAHTATAAVKVRGPHYVHEYMMEFSGEHLTADGEKELVEASRELARWLYRALEAEYEWQMADAQVDDAIRANEYEFNAAGGIE